MIPISALAFTTLLSGFTGKLLGATDTPSRPETGKAQVWLTQGDRAKLLNREADLPLTAQPAENWPVIVVDPSVTYQSIDGYGAALTGSSAFLINRKLSADQRQTVLESLFCPQAGIGISYVRLTMGASDFSLSDFTYNDLPAGQTDFELKHFSLSQDLEDVIPVMQEIIALAPELQIMGSPWSPPAWMKTNQSLKGGQLRTDCYDVYARYFVRYIQAMRDHGIIITSVTPQNEPLYFTATYPCMEMQSAEQMIFIRDHLGPRFAAAGITAKILIYDHNWDDTEYAISLLNDPAARRFVAGTAFHGYAGQVSAMSVVHDAHPDKELHFSEISGGGWGPKFGPNLMWFMRNVFIGTANNWSKSALMWNLALDENHGPKNSGCPDCRGVITINQATGQITYNEEFYALGHFSKFVRPGARRIGLTLPPSLSHLVAVAFQNLNGTKVMVVANYGSDTQTFSVNQGNKYFSRSIPPISIVTLVW